MRRNDYDVTASIQTTNPAAVSREVLRIYFGLYENEPAAEIERGFALATALYRGDHPAYFPCDTEYHDIQHVLDVTLAMARLLDGYERSRAANEPSLTREVFVVGVLTALFHDFGYLRRRNDRNHLYGAEYTLIHVTRSAAFLRRYLRELGMEEKYSRAAAILVHYTGYERPTETIRISDRLLRRVGQMLGTADIIAQMSDRCYLEKCRDRLFPEFVLGGRAAAPGKRRLPVFASGDDLVRRTPAFCEGALRRLELQLARAYQYAAKHFGGTNAYIEEMQKNVRYAQAISGASITGLLRRQPPRTLSPGVEPYPKGLISV